MQARTVVNQCYILQEKLGEDGFCELWRATSVFAAAEFLLRFLKERPGLAERIEPFRREMMTAYAISHPAVADVVEFETFEGRWFLASAFNGQSTLRSLYEKGVSFSLEHLCRYVLELAQGVDAFHGLGLVYKCLNSDNALFILRQGRVEGVQVQKPGYAILLDLIDEGNRGDWIETWAYAAPEVKRGSAEVDQRADVYSLGIHLFRFLAGRLPYPEEPGFVRKEAASLSHVAKALLRRGVPEALVRIALRALRPDPRRRYQDCVRFIAELRDFTDERRAEWLRRSGIDPLANIETLNRAGGRIGASQIVRSLDTADYFRLLSEVPAERPEPKAVRTFPFTAFSDPQAVRSLEVVEASVRDAGVLEEDAYLHEARAAVSKEPWAVAEEEPLRDPRLEHVPPAEEAEAPAIVDDAFLDTTEEAPADAEELAEPEGLSIDATRPGKRSGAQPETADIAWKGSRFRQESLIGTLEAAFTRAGHGRGAFRFIQEPEAPQVAAALGRAFGRFKEEAFFVDGAAFGPGADATDLLRHVRGPLARALAGEAPKTRRLLSRRISGLGGDVVMAAAPLGTALLGFDLPEPDPDFLETPEGATLVASTLLAFGRRTRPLVMVFRGGELIGPSIHRILLELARRAPLAPLCCFVFFGREAKVPAWHVLSKLGRQEELPEVEKADPGPPPVGTSAKED